MRFDAKAPKGFDLRERVATLTLKADNVGDAIALNKLYLLVRDGRSKDGRWLWEKGGEG